MANWKKFKRSLLEYYIYYTSIMIFNKYIDLNKNGQIILINIYMILGIFSLLDNSLRLIWD